MRRSHLMLAGAVAIAGGAALLGSRDGTSVAGPSRPAEIRGDALDEPGSAGRAAWQRGVVDGEPKAEKISGKAARADAVAKRTALTSSTLNALLDLDQVKLVGDHYEAKLKDGRLAVLTLDPALQAYAEKLLTEARAPRGAIVAMAPDGRILALAGRSRDPEKPRARAKDKKRASDDDEDGGDDSKAPLAPLPAVAAAVADATKAPLMNWRLATDVWAPAASVFKLVTASALVSAGVDPFDKVCFHGGIRSVMESNLHDDKRDSRCENLTYGVAHSNNAILGKLAYQKLQPASLVKLSNDLGITGAFTGPDLSGSAGAIAIPPERDLSFAKTAAGFAGSQLSAVGGALLAATFADEGEQPAPRIIASIDGTDVPAPPRRRAVTAEVARAVGKMMVATCEMGSASKSFGRHQAIKVAGKTGTLTRTEPFYMEHSWFVGFAPAESPQIVVSVVLGNPENWHLRGHEAARRLIDRALRPARAHDKDRGVKISSTRRVGW